MSDVIVQRQGALGRLTLNRPKALNALTRDMVRAIARALTDWREDPQVTAVLIEGAGERGLCAGGDIRSIYDAAREGRYDCDAFWAEEYVVNAAIARYPKPYLAVMDGIVMGGGVGVSAHGSHRIVTERTRLAMPEVSIGFVPDVGGTWLLAHAPGELGLYAGLTGLTMNGADAIACGLADHCVPSGRLPELIGELAACKDRSAIEQKLKRFAVQPEQASRLAAERQRIDACFSAQSVDAILARLDADASAFAQDTAARLRRNCPASLKVTLRAIRAARTFASLEAALRMEYRIATHCIRRADMLEGIRAAVVDKDQKPFWSPAALDSVDPQCVDAFFEAAPAGDLDLWAPGEPLRPA